MGDANVEPRGGGRGPIARRTSEIGRMLIGRELFNESQ